MKGRARPRRDRERRENARASKVCHSPPSRRLGRAIAGGYRTRAHGARVHLRARARPPGAAGARAQAARRRRPRPSPRTRRHPRRFNDVATSSTLGSVAFPTRFTRLVSTLWPTSCFPVGNCGCGRSRSASCSRAPSETRPTGKESCVTLDKHTDESLKIIFQTPVASIQRRPFPPAAPAWTTTDHSTTPDTTPRCSTCTGVTAAPK